MEVWPHDKEVHFPVAFTTMFRSASWNWQTREVLQQLCGYLVLSPSPHTKERYDTTQPVWSRILFYPSPDERLHWLGIAQTNLYSAGNTLTLNRLGCSSFEKPRQSDATGVAWCNMSVQYVKLPMFIRVCTWMKHTIGVPRRIPL